MAEDQEPHVTGYGVNARSTGRSDATQKPARPWRLRNERVRRPDHERHEERSEGQRGHQEYRQRDIGIWKTIAQHPEETSRSRLPFWFRKHATPQY